MSSLWFSFASHNMSLRWCKSSCAFRNVVEPETRCCCFCSNNPAVAISQDLTDASLIKRDFNRKTKPTPFPYQPYYGSTLVFSPYFQDSTWLRVLLCLSRFVTVKLRNIRFPTLRGPLSSHYYSSTVAAQCGIHNIKYHTCSISRGSDSSASSKVIVLTPHTWRWFEENGRGFSPAGDH